MTAIAPLPYVRPASRPLFRGPAVGIGYHLWLRLRWALLALASIIVCGAILVRFPPMRVAPAMVAGVAAMVFGWSSISFLVVFGYVSKDYNSNESTFPPYMLAMPVRTRGLVGVPMAMALAVMAFAWMAFSRLVLLPAGFHVPEASIFVMAAGTLMWFQAITWCPFWYSMVRVTLLVLAGVVFLTAGAVGLMAPTLGVPSPMFLAGYAAVALAAYPVGVAGLARARRGDGLRAPWANRRDRTHAARPSKPPFPSAARAQLWWEIRRNVMIQVAAITFLLTLGALMLTRIADEPWHIAGRDIKPSLALFVLALVLPRFATGLNAGMLGKFDTFTKSLAIPSFIGTRPMTCGGLVAAKLRAAAVSVALTFVGMWVVAWAYALLPNSYGPGKSLASFVADHATWPRAAKVAGVLLLLILDAWKNLAGSLYKYVMGKEWLPRVVGIGSFIVMAAVGFLIYRVTIDPRLRHVLLTAAPYAVYTATGLKIAAAVVTFRACVRAGTMSRRQVELAVAGWIILAAAMAGITLAQPAAHAVPRAWVVCFAVIYVPVSRLALAPLALRFNRHQ